jgi:hypothetical protein
MPEGLRLLNGFLHDLATGFWLALLITAAALRRALSAAGLIEAGRPVLLGLFWWSVAALAVILGTGVYRAAAYRDDKERSPDLKRRLLWGKHLLLGLAFALGTGWLYRLAFAG